MPLTRAFRAAIALVLALVPGLSTAADKWPVVDPAELATKTPKVEPNADAEAFLWDVRVTASLVSWMIAVAYLILRRYGGPGSEKLAAGLALFGMANVPFIYISVNYWRTVHPATSVVPKLPVSMGVPLWFCVSTFLLTFILLFKMRVRLEEQRARLDAIYLSLDE